RNGSISDSTLRDFIDDCLGDFQQGEQFAHDYAFAAICVAVQNRTSPISEEFLFHLAKLNIPEMAIGIRVARECLQHRIATNTLRKTYRVLASERNKMDSVLAPRSNKRRTYCIDSVNSPTARFEIA
ncbi:MAG: hypothetical protein KDA84_17525, partial [Planctomycetaceae bacterium]|nr:hypothetical protein [Planctomycetaceae bacterium]